MSELQAKGLVPRQLCHPHSVRSPADLLAKHLVGQQCRPISQIRRNTLGLAKAGQQQRPDVAGTCLAAKPTYSGKCPEAGPARGMVPSARMCPAPTPTSRVITEEEPSLPRDENRGFGTARSQSQGLHMEGDVRGNPLLCLGDPLGVSSAAAGSWGGGNGWGERRGNDSVRPRSAGPSLNENTVLETGRRRGLGSPGPQQFTHRNRPT